MYTLVSSTSLLVLVLIVSVSLNMAKHVRLAQLTVGHVVLPELVLIILHRDYVMLPFPMGVVELYLVVILIALSINHVHKLQIVKLVEFV
jgi:hypothetical protein